MAGDGARWREMAGDGARWRVHDREHVGHDADSLQLGGVASPTRTGVRGLAPTRGGHERRERASDDGEAHPVR